MSENGYDGLKLTISVLEEFAKDVSKARPPDISYELLRNGRGWSAKIDINIEKADLPSLPRSELLRVCSRLAATLAKLDVCIKKWEKILENEDPLLISYNHMPIDFQNMDSVRIVAERVDFALHEVMIALFPVKKRSIWAILFRRRR